MDGELADTVSYYRSASPSGDTSYRSLIVAGPGNVLVDVDYDQMELRILGARSYDSAMLADATV